MIAERPVLAALAAAVSAVVLTGLVRAVAIRLDFVSRPRGERFAHDAKPLAGGVAIVAAWLLGLLVATSGQGAPDLGTISLALGAVAFAVLGLVDDARDLRAHVKLIAQILIAGVLVYVWEVALGQRAEQLGVSVLPIDERARLPGVGLPLDDPLLRAPLTVVWLVVVTNAVNLLDNMDGLAGSVTAVTATFVAALAASGGNAPTAIAAGAVAGACVGYLVWNFPPARIYMGDCGSLPLGFLLAALAARGGASETSSFTVALGAPALALAVPLFDTVFVSVLRRLHGRSIFQGGRDHTSHRLVVLGLDERRTVLVFSALAAAGGAAAFLLEGSSLALRIVIVVGAGVLLFGVGAFLAEVSVYPDVPRTISGRLAIPKEARRGGFVVVTSALRERAQTIIRVVLDASVLSLCFLGANVARFGDAVPDYATVIVRSLPLFVGIKLVVFVQAGLYQRTETDEDGGTDELFRIVRAAAIGSFIAIAAAALAVRLENYSRAVFVLDGIFTVAAIGATRLLVPFLRDTVAGWSRPTGAATPTGVPRPRAVLVGPTALEPLARTAFARADLELVGVVDVERTGDAADDADDPDPIGALVIAAAHDLGASTAVILGADDRDASPSWRDRARAAGLDVRVLTLAVADANRDEAR